MLKHVKPKEKTGIAEPVFFLCKKFKEYTFRG